MVGSLQKDGKYLDELIVSLSGDTKPTVDISVIWPTVETVRDSNYGYVEGGSICGDSKNIEERKILDMYHNWEPG